MTYWSLFRRAFEYCVTRFSNSLTVCRKRLNSRAMRCAQSSNDVEETTFTGSDFEDMFSPPSTPLIIEGGHIPEPGFNRRPTTCVAFSEDRVPAFRDFFT